MKNIFSFKRKFLFLILLFTVIFVLVIYSSKHQRHDLKETLNPSIIERKSSLDEIFEKWLKKWGPSMEAISKAYGQNHYEGDIFQQNGSNFIKVPQIKSYFKLIQENKNSISRICETGFHEGHSALMWAILFNGDIDIISFDLCGASHCKIGIDIILSYFPNVKLHVVKGDSRKTVPEFVLKNPSIKCNIISIDGGHIDNVPKKDLENMRLMAAKNHFVLVDDANANSTISWLRTPGRAWEEAVREQLICPKNECQNVCHPLIPALPMKFCIGTYC